jgi:hypothetical protein
MFWIFEVRTLSTQPVRRRCGMCGVYRFWGRFIFCQIIAAREQQTSRLSWRAVTRTVTSAAPAEPAKPHSTTHASNHLFITLIDPAQARGV